MKRKLLLSLLAWQSVVAFAQSYVHVQSTGYQWPDDERVVQKLHEWQDLKFGIILHWGVYSVPGICESWTITSEDWITPDTTRTYDEYKQWYWGLSKDFNPVSFSPEQWAGIAKAAGMRYVVFTTKHHDGFCLWNSRQTDYTVAHSGFAGNAKEDVTRYVFDAFRSQDMMVGCYFSKPDWHHPDYWWPVRATPDRHHNYSIAQHPEKWSRYKSFVFNQVEELMKDYGPVDILWLDGGWCTAPREDIGLDSIVDMARAHQPGLIVVERACPGKHENYQTPEQKIPSGQINTPWESCITLTDDWGWVSKPSRYKSPATIIRMLSEVTAKGGSLLLGVGPTPEGIIEKHSEDILRQVGKWLERNGNAIYGTVTTPVYTNESQSVWFTADKNGKTLYGISVRKDDETPLPTELVWEGNIPRKGTKMTLLDGGKPLRWRVEKDGRVHVTLPSRLLTADAVAFQMIRQADNQGR